MRRFPIYTLLTLLAALFLSATACQTFFSGSGDGGGFGGGPGGGSAGTVAAEVVAPPGGLAVETVVEGLEIPWDLAFTPDGRIFITERPGRIRVVKDGVLQDDSHDPYAAIDVFHRSEAGLMGIALHPRFADNGYLYVCYTYREGRSTFNRIARLTDRGDQAVNHQVILDDIPGATRHDGCRIRFGPGRLPVRHHRRRHRPRPVPGPGLPGGEGAAHGGRRVGPAE